MASYDLKAILGEKLKRLTDKTLKALVDCMCTVGASLCSLDKRVSALESVELPEGGYKPMQEPVASPSANGTEIQFIESVSQDATGRMTATKKTVRDGSTSQKGVVQLEDSHSSTSTTKAATPNSVKSAYDLANTANTGAVKNVAYDSTNKKITKTINGQTTDVVSAATLKTDMALNNVDNTSDANKPVSTAQQAALDLKLDKTAVTSLTDWNTLADTGLYIVNTSNTVANEPERGKVACYVTNIDRYISQLAVGDKVYMRFKRALEPSWQPWVVLQDSSGTTASELYSSTQGGYFSIARAALETANSTGTTSIAGGTTTISDNNSAHTTTITPEHVVVGAQGGSTIIEPGVVTVNGLELNTKADVTAAIPASSNEKLKNITHLLVNGNKTLKLSEMIEDKAYVFHVVSSGAVVTIYNDSSSAYTIRHRGSDISLALNSSASLNSSTDPAGEIWLARVGTNIYMSKSCETGTVQDSLKWNGYSLSLGGTPTAGSGTIYFT